MSESWRVATEHRQRTGHRFNIIVNSLLEREEGAMSFEELLKKLVDKGYIGGLDELKENLDALERRGEVASTLGKDQKRFYWTLPKGKLEFRKRRALIKLHVMELKEEAIKKLEEMAFRES